MNRRIGSAVVALAWLAASCNAPHDGAVAGRTASVSVVADTTKAADLAAFRARIGPPPAHLAGFRTRDSLVAAFASAVQSRDSAALRRLALTVEEYAYLYYPFAPLARPPYALDPETMWIQIGSSSDRGYVRLLRDYGGRLGYESYRCEDRPTASGPVTLWNGCTVRHRTDGRTIAEPLFGSIIERDGWYKFVGLSNRL